MTFDINEHIYEGTMVFQYMQDTPEKQKALINKWIYIKLLTDLLEQMLVKYPPKIEILEWGQAKVSSVFLIMWEEEIENFIKNKY